MVSLSENKIIFEEKSSKEMSFIDEITALIKAYIESFLELEFEEAISKKGLDKGMAIMKNHW